MTVRLRRRLPAPGCPRNLGWRGVGYPSLPERSREDEHRNQTTCLVWTVGSSPWMARPTLQSSMCSPGFLWGPPLPGHVRLFSTDGTRHNDTRWRRRRLRVQRSSTCIAARSYGVQMSSWTEPREGQTQRPSIVATTTSGSSPRTARRASRRATPGSYQIPGLAEGATPL